jgi:hypothetical protein
MKPEKDGGCSCPHCHDCIPAEFYCRHCDYVPDWRHIEPHEEYRGFAEVSLVAVHSAGYLLFNA